MAIHYSIPSMLQESLVEIFLVSRDCINFRKDPKLWKSSGCYGYPALILLFVIADSIGSYVIGRNTRRHFDILDHPDFYNLKLGKNKIDIIYEKYRCLLTHNGVLAKNMFLNIGNNKSAIFEINKKICSINLIPFLNLTKKVLKKFLENCDEIVNKSQKLKEIIKE